MYQGTGGGLWTTCRAGRPWPPAAHPARSAPGDKPARWRTRSTGDGRATRRGRHTATNRPGGGHGQPVTGGSRGGDGRRVGGPDGSAVRARCAPQRSCRTNGSILATTMGARISVSTAGDEARQNMGQQPVAARPGRHAGRGDPVHGPGLYQADSAPEGRPARFAATRRSGWNRAVSGCWPVRTATSRTPMSRVAARITSRTRRGVPLMAGPGSPSCGLRYGTPGIHVCVCRSVSEKQAPTTEPGAWTDRLRRDVAGCTPLRTVPATPSRTRCRCPPGPASRPRRASRAAPTGPATCR